MATYADEQASMHCKLCGLGRWTPARGSSVCERCDGATYHAGDGVCYGCPPNAVCDSIRAAAAPGYYLHQGRNHSMQAFHWYAQQDVASLIACLLTCCFAARRTCASAGCPAWASPASLRTSL